MDLQLEGKTAIVTGGSRGIGKAVARVLSADGCSVVITGRYADTLSESAEDIAGDTGGRVVPIVSDMTSTDQVNAMVAQAAEALGGRIDILVNNAAAPGGLARGSLAEIRDEDVMLDLDTKVMGYLRCARAVAPYMQQQGWGRIVNVGGLSARRAEGNLSAGVRNSGSVQPDQVPGRGTGRRRRLRQPGASRHHAHRAQRPHVRRAGRTGGHHRRRDRASRRLAQLHPPHR